MRTTGKFETILSALIILFALAFFVYLKIATGIGQFTGYDLHVRMPDAKNLTVGSDVRLGGIKVGTIVGLVLEQQPYAAVLNLRIRGDLLLPEDTDFPVMMPSFGNSYLGIVPGRSKKRLPAGGRRDIRDKTVLHPSS